MLCIKCGKEMVLDDKDFNFRGNYDNYWLCSPCKIGCEEQVRFGQSFREIWTEGEFSLVIMDIRKNIDVPKKVGRRN